MRREEKFYVPPVASEEETNPSRTCDIGEFEARSQLEPTYNSSKYLKVINHANEGK